MKNLRREIMTRFEKMMNELDVYINKYCYEVKRQVRLDVDDVKQDILIKCWNVFKKDEDWFTDEKNTYIKYFRNVIFNEYKNIVNGQFRKKKAFYRDSYLDIYEEEFSFTSSESFEKNLILKMEYEEIVDNVESQTCKKYLKTAQELKLGTIDEIAEYFGKSYQSVWNVLNREFAGKKLQFN
jgi:DNA-directed RNA polymerase specialized sigma24 family protein